MCQSPPSPCELAKSPHACKQSATLPAQLLTPQSARSTVATRVNPHMRSYGPVEVEERIKMKFTKLALKHVRKSIYYLLFEWTVRSVLHFTNL